MRRTEAPASARRRPEKGAGARPASSRTLRPVRGGGEGIVLCDGGLGATWYRGFQCVTGISRVCWIVHLGRDGSWVGLKQQREAI